MFSPNSGNSESRQLVLNICNYRATWLPSYKWPICYIFANQHCPFFTNFGHHQAAISPNIAVYETPPKFQQYAEISAVVHAEERRNGAPQRRLKINYKKLYFLLGRKNPAAFTAGFTSLPKFITSPSSLRLPSPRQV